MTTIANPSRLIPVINIEWKPLQPGVQAKTLFSDPATKRRIIMSRFEAGAVLKLHRHIGDEVLFVIEGDIVDEHGAVTPGNVGFRPNGCVHTVSTTTGATAIAIVTGSSEPATSAAGAPPSQVFNVIDTQWTESMPGVHQKRIWEDPASKRRAILGRLDANAALPRHRHDGDEFVFMLEGANADESGVLAAGNASYRPNGCVHTVSSKAGCTFFSVVWGGVDML